MMSSDAGDFRHEFCGKVILVTGAAGTVGKALVRRLLDFNPQLVLGLDNNESELFFLKEELGDGFQPVLGDVRDVTTLERAFRRVDVIFHAAALKHVPLCEHNPLEAVQTNILGVQNVIQAARAAGVARVVYTSSDKAVNPPNVMGTSKLMGEKLMNAANVGSGRDGQVFTTTRFGNVLGSRGSVIPLFREQIRRGGPVRLTDRDMTRFIMTLPEAVDLVLLAGAIARGGEVLITKMSAIRIADLARVMIDALAPTYGHAPGSIEIVEVGRRPGEKVYEELMNEEEVRRSIELDKFFVVLPALPDICPTDPLAYGPSKPVDQAYNSDAAALMPADELSRYLTSVGLLNP